jgi:hypothetical protein
MIFFVMDESSAYFQVKDKKDVKATPQIGHLCEGKPHFFWSDKAFLETIINSDIDFVIWYTPFKLLNTDKGKFPLPRVCVYDVKGAKYDTVDFDEKAMRSCEV